MYKKAVGQKVKSICMLELEYSSAKLKVSKTSLNVFIYLLKAVIVSSTAQGHLRVFYLIKSYTS